MRLIHFLLLGALTAGCQQPPAPETPPQRTPPSPAVSELVVPADPAVVAAVVNGTGYVSLEALRETAKKRQMELLEQEEWEALETLIRKLDQDQVTLDGFWTRRAVLDDNWRNPGTYISESWRAVALTERWSKARPKAGEARAAQVLATAGCAWDVSRAEDAWASDGSSGSQFVYLRDKTDALSQKMLSQGVQVAQAATASLQVALSTSRQPEATFAEALDTFVKGNRATPNYFPVWKAMATYSLPGQAGGGKNDYLQAFIQRAAEVQKPEQADTGPLRACVATPMISWPMSPFTPEWEGTWDSKRILHGLDLLLATQPGHLELLNTKAWMAFHAGAWEQARPTFDLIGPNWSQAVWRSGEKFAAASADAMRRLPPSGQAPVAWKALPVGPEGPPQLSEQTFALLKEERYADLDAVYAHMAKTPDRLPDFYARLGAGESGKKEYERALGGLERWLKASPQSVPARLALAQLYVNYAWYARGSGWADSVTEEGRKAMQERLDKAKTLLQEAADLGARDPHLASVRLSVLLGSGGDGATARKVAAEGLALAPTDPAGLRASMVMFLLPRWHGEPGEAGRYLREESRRTGDTTLLGRELAGQVAFLGAGLEEELGFTWPELRKSLRQALASDSSAVPSALLFMAATHRDRETAREALRALKKPDLSILGSAQLVESCRRWAAGGPLNPLTPTQIVKVDSGQYRWSKDGWTPTLVSTSHRVPLKDGSAFGFRLKQVQRVPGRPLKLAFRWEHPEWLDPNTNSKSSGRTHTYHIYVDDLGTDGNELETFQESWRHEWLPGTWRVTTLVDDQELFTEEFEVYQP